MKDGDVEELSAEIAVEATNKDLEELAKPGIGGSDDQDDKVSLSLQELCLSQQPKYQNVILPSKKCSMTWKSVTFCLNVASH